MVNKNTNLLQHINMKEAEEQRLELKEEIHLHIFSSFFISHTVRFVQFFSRH